MVRHCRFARLMRAPVPFIQSAYGRRPPARTHVSARAHSRARRPTNFAAKDAEGRLGSPGRPRHSAIAPELGRRLFKEHPKGEAASMSGEARIHAMGGSIALAEDFPRRRPTHLRDGPLRRLYQSSLFRHRDRTSLRTKRKRHQRGEWRNAPIARAGGLSPAGSRIVLPASPHPRDRLLSFFSPPPGPRNDEGRLGYPGRPPRSYSAALGRLRVRLRVGNFDAATRDGRIKAMIEPTPAQETPRRRRHHR